MCGASLQQAGVGAFFDGTLPAASRRPEMVSWADHNRVRLWHAYGGSAPYHYPTKLFFHATFNAPDACAGGLKLGAEGYICDPCGLARASPTKGFYRMGATQTNAST